MINETFSNTPVRNIKARVELCNGSILANTFNSEDVLKSIKIERVGESKFFGFGYCQKANIHLIDPNRQLNITTANSIKVYFNDVNNFPCFWVSEVHRDENTGELSITAYDAIYNSYTFNDLNMGSSYTIQNVIDRCAELLKTQLITLDLNDWSVIETEYPNGANFDGTETIREVLNAIAEATQTIYFLTHTALVFKRLDVSGDAVYTIDKEQYIDLDSGTNRRLASIVSVTELGDNVEAALEYTGTTQYVRDNPFWDMREDIGQLVENALTAVGGLTINQFNCSWRGNYLLELGDKIDIINKDNSITTSYFLNDTITYNGAYSQETMWQYEDTEGTENNPSTLGEQLKQTYARVDKANKQITLLASEAEANSKAIATLQINTDSINTTVKAVEESAQQNAENTNRELAELESKIEQTATELNIEISNKLNAVDSVTTSTGFTFDSNGLTIEKSGSEMKTTITDDGMKVYRDNTEMLTANNQGVNAVNLHATTYLIIGNNSRFEDYGSSRTGCFWIGG